MKSNLSIDIDLNVDMPEKVPALLNKIADQFEAAAQDYDESQSELQSAWTDPNAGQVWPHLANRMRGAAGYLRKQARAAEANIRRYV